MTIGKGRYIQFPNKDGGENYYGLLNAEIYSLRIYGRAFTDDEVEKNYTKTVEYHRLLMMNDN